MSFTLKDIKGAVVEKKLFQANTEIGRGEHRIIGFNDGVRAQSSVPLRFNREKLARGIYNHRNHNVFDGDKEWNQEKETIKKLYFILADAIIAAGPELIEVAHE